MTHHILDWIFLHNMWLLESLQSPGRNLLPSTPSCSQLAADTAHAQRKRVAQKQRVGLGADGSQGLPPIHRTFRWSHDVFSLLLEDGMAQRQSWAQ